MRLAAFLLAALVATVAITAILTAFGVTHPAVYLLAGLAVSVPLGAIIL